MTSPSPPLPPTTALRRLKASHDGAAAAEALKRGENGRAADLFLSSAACLRLSSSSRSSGGGDAAARTRALSNASAALSAAGRFKEALEAADEAAKLSRGEEEEEEGEEEEGEDDDGGEREGERPPSLALSPSLPQQKRKKKPERLLGWSKPHWRRGVALRGLGRNLEAALAFSDARRALEAEEGARTKDEGAGGGDEASLRRLEECSAAVGESVTRGARRAADAASLLCDAVFARAEREGRIPASPVSGGGIRPWALKMRAAAASVVSGRANGDDDEGNDGGEAQNAPTLPSYLSSLSSWLASPPPTPRILVERSAVLAAAGEWRAAVEDARRALELATRREEEERIESERNDNPFRVGAAKSKSKPKKTSTRLSPTTSDAATLALARALLARRGSPDRDCRAAARELALGVRRIRERVSSLPPPSSPSPTPAREGEAAARERAASALSSPLVEALRKVQESEELLPGEVGDILLWAEGGKGGGKEGETAAAPPPLLARSLRLEVDVSSPLDAKTRKALLASVAEACEVPRGVVALERLSTSSSPSTTTTTLSVSVSSFSFSPEEKEAIASLEKHLLSSLAEREGGGVVAAVRATTATPFGEGGEKKEEENDDVAPPSSLSSSSLVPRDSSLPLAEGQRQKKKSPVRPELVPRLTDSGGAPLPPPRFRHAFALSRVHYSSRDQSSRSADTWLDVPGLGIRWRQSASEVSVIVYRRRSSRFSPADGDGDGDDDDGDDACPSSLLEKPPLRASDFEVEMTPRRLFVSLRREERGERSGGQRGGLLALEGAGAGATLSTAMTKAAREAPSSSPPSSLALVDLELDRMIVPDESTWELLDSNGNGREGILLLTLAKANVELFLSRDGSPSSSPSPSITWWPRLSRDLDETSVAWDDYEKDYSDLPAFAAERVNAAEEAQRLQERSGGGSGDNSKLSTSHLDRALRRSLAVEDDSRRKRRAERLAEMRREAISKGEERGKNKL